MLGSDALIFQDYERPVIVTGYDPEGPTKTAKTVSGAVAYDDPEDESTKILIINQAILIPSIKHNLLCPMQLRLNDIIVNETPKFLCEAPTD